MQKILFLIFISILVTGEICFSQEVLPYWDKEIARFKYDQRSWHFPCHFYYREVVQPKGGSYYRFDSYVIEDSERAIDELARLVSRYREKAQKDARYEDYVRRYQYILENIQNKAQKKADFLSQFDPNELKIIRKLKDNIFQLAQLLMVQISESKNEFGFYNIESICITNQEDINSEFYPFLWAASSGGSESGLSVNLNLLERFSRLKHLEIYGCSTTSFDMQYLSDLELLEYIGLPSDSNDAVFNHLTELERLEFINASGTCITGSNFEQFAKLPNLNILDLRYTRLCEDAITKLKNVKTLKTLLLTGAKVTDRHLKDIGELKGLQNLSLTGTDITDVTLKEIEILPELKFLTLGQTKVTWEGKRQLQKSRPDLKIVSGPVLLWTEQYKIDKLYRQAQAGELDAQVDIYNKYYKPYYFIIKTKWWPEDHFEKITGNSPWMLDDFPLDLVELLKWVNVLLDKSDRLKPDLVSELEETLADVEKRLSAAELEEVRRRVALFLSLENDYILSKKKEFYEYLPIYQVEFPFIHDEADDIDYKKI